MAGLLLFAPLLPFVLKPLAIGLFGPKAPVVVSLDVWRQIVLSEPLRLVTGHGLETALRGRFFGLIPPTAPSTLLFEIWYELGLVGAAAGSIILYQAATRARIQRATVGPASWRPSPAPSPWAVSASAPRRSGGSPPSWSWC